MRVKNLTASYATDTKAPFLPDYTAVVVNLSAGSLTFSTADDNAGTNVHTTVVPAGTAAEVTLQAYFKSSAAVGLVLLGN